MNLFDRFKQWLADQKTFRQLQAIKQDVDARITYKHYYGRDFRYIAPGVRGEGNCAVFAATYLCDVTSKYGAKVTTTLDYIDVDGNGKKDHVRLIVNGRWILDCRYKTVMEVGE